jgi:hypothetical protein
MADLRKGVCKGCGGPVLWATTEATGKWLSLDPEPVSGGNVTLLADGRAHVLTKSELGGLFADPAVRYMPHRATCTNWPSSNKR